MNIEISEKIQKDQNYSLLNQNISNRNYDDQSISKIKVESFNQSNIGR